MLQKQNFFISLAQGISTKEDPKQVIPGKLLLLENAVFTSPKEIRKRYGYLALSTTATVDSTVTEYGTLLHAIPSGNFLASFNNEIILNTDFSLYSFSDSSASWIYKARNTICKLSSLDINRNTSSQSVADSAINPIGVQVFAWEDSSGTAHLSVMDTISGQLIVANRPIPPSGVGTTIKPKCIYFSNKIIIFYLDTTTNMQLKFISYNNGVFSAPVTVSAVVNVTHNNYDTIVTNNKLYVTFNTSSASITTLYYSPSLVASATDTQAVNADNCITIFTDILANLWVAYATNTSVDLFILNTLLDTIVLPPTAITLANDVYNITGINGSGNSIIMYDIKGVADTDGYFSNAQITYFRVSITGANNGPYSFLNSVGLQSKLFTILVNGTYVPHVLVSHDAALQPTYFLCNVYDDNPTLGLPTANVAAKVAPSLAGGLPASPSSLSFVNTLSDGVFQTAVLKKDLLFTFSDDNGTVHTYSQLGVASYLFDFTVTNLNNIVLGNNLHISSGMLSMYDGANTVEHNFHLYPEAVTITVNTSGGNLTDNSAYGYQVTYEWTDNQGQLHRSSPSPIISILTGAHSNASQAVLTIPTLRVTAKDNVNIVVYRTQANGTVYYRLNSPLSPLYNSVTADSVMYTDNASDLSIGANQQLYTTGGEVPNTAAPATSIVGEFKNRVILIPSENPSSWQFSKQVIPGSPVEFSNEFVQNIGTEGGPITAFIQMDSNGIFFKEKSIFYVSGEGPAPSGANNDFSQALAIASDVGCINAQSLILMPAGIIFKSSKGIYLLSRALAVEYIGSDVEAFNNDTITSAQLINYTNQIRFTLDSGVTLVYDYFVSQWSVFTNINAVSSLISGNVFTYLESTGRTSQETSGMFMDNGSPIRMKLVTSWLSLSGIQGFQRIYKALVLGQYFGPHNLSVEFAYDFNPINSQQVYINATNALNSNVYGGDPSYALNSPYGGEFPTYQWRIFTDKQVCEAIQITIQDLPFAGTYTNLQGLPTTVTYGESMSLSSISLELGMKKGLNKLPANRSFGV